MAAPGGCYSCGLATYIQPVFDKFKERVCRACIKLSDGFKTITKSTAKADYLLTDSDLAKLPFELKPNPRNSRFSDMHLYLVKQVVRTQPRTDSGPLASHWCPVAGYLAVVFGA